MAYEKQTFVDDVTILSAAHLDHIENGIMESVSYTEQTLTEEQKTQARKNIDAIGMNDVSCFGFKYSTAEHSFDISATDGKSSVMMYLFPADCGYAAVVAGSGVMMNHDLELHRNYKVKNENRAYADYLKQINKVYIESGVTTIGDFFMHQAYYLSEVVFEDSSKITYLGKNCFACTQISGEYKFCNLNNGTTVDRSFFCCPKLQGITLGVSATENRNFKLSEMAFFGCLDLQYFKIDNPLNTSAILGKASFEYCMSLRFVELHTNSTTPEGFNFLMNPAMGCILKRHMDTTKGVLAYTPVINIAKKQWNYVYDEDGKRIAPYISSLERWASSSALRTKLAAIQAVASEYPNKSHQLAIYATDEQKKDEYLIDNPTFALDSKGVFWGKGSSGVYRVPYYGSCWLFAYMHIWNILHPIKQYDSIENFVAMLQETKITVDAELQTAFESWDFLSDVMATGVYADGYFNTGNEIYATDLPTAKTVEGSYTTLGSVGEASWGVRKVLGWTGERLTETADRSWADVKKSAIDSIFAGKPVLFECVGYGGDDTTNDTYGGLHAVAAIGYDAKTDMFKVIDSTWGIPSDVAKMEYWTTFEALLEPSEESAVWVFSAFDSGATLTAAK